MKGKTMKMFYALMIFYKTIILFKWFAEASFAQGVGQKLDDRFSLVTASSETILD
jgi:hypothetical protein